MARLILIAGGGRFGSRAARYFESRGDRVLVIDKDPGCPAAGLVDKIMYRLPQDPPPRGSAYLIVGDVPKLLLDAYCSGLRPDIVVPMIPGRFTVWWHTVIYSTRALGSHPIRGRSPNCLGSPALKVYSVLEQGRMLDRTQLYGSGGEVPRWMHVTAHIPRHG